MTTNANNPPPICEVSVQVAIDFGIWLHDRTNGLELPATEDRLRISQPLFYLALEHYDSIVILLSHRLIGSAFALARPLLEACVRGKWIICAATDTDIQKFSNGKLEHRFQYLLDQIGNTPEAGGAWLKETKRLNWNALNDLTHGGIHQVLRRVTEEYIESNYPLEEQARLVSLAIEVAILTARELFVLAKRGPLIAELETKANFLRTIFSAKYKENLP